MRDPSLPKSQLDAAGAFDAPGDVRGLGCCPYLQLFKGGHLVFTAALQSGSTSSATHTTENTDADNADGSADSADGPAWAYPSDLSVAFAVDTILQVHWSDDMS